MMLSYLKDEIRNFSEGTFGERTDPKGCLNHLKLEVDELLEAIGKENEDEEWGDCLLLLLDAFRVRFGNEVSYNRYLHICLNKLDVAKKREWEKTPDENGIHLHKKT